MGKLNPRQYIKRHLEKEKANEKALRLAREDVEKKNNGFKKSGRKSKKEREVEERMKDQAAFLLFLKKEKEVENSTSPKPKQENS